MKPNYNVVGIMAGSSMDGLDMALVNFQLESENWKFKVIKSETIPYDEWLFNDLKTSSKKSHEVQKKLDLTFGEWISTKVSLFIPSLSIDLIALHGHTVVHKPSEKISWQLGSGAVVANTLRIPTISDFRSLDVSIGGEGAPLVPFGDFTLFSNFDYCLNLGGIANISCKAKSIAWDICPCNQVLNYYANRIGLPYDENGEHGRKGVIIEDFITTLSSLPYFKRNPPKSLPNDFIDQQLLDMLDPLDGLRSYSSFVARQLHSDLSTIQRTASNMLITGGGAFNSLLMDELRETLKGWELVIPDHLLISYKEAIIFGFLGLKRLLGEINVLSSVTGGRKDTSSGVIHLPK